jgi:hypothetical protein
MNLGETLKTHALRCRPKLLHLHGLSFLSGEIGRKIDKHVAELFLICDHPGEDAREEALLAVGDHYVSGIERIRPEEDELQTRRRGA